MYNSLAKIYLFAIALLPATGGYAHAGEQVAPLNIKAAYEFNFAAFRLGKMGIEVAQTPQNYSIAADIVSTGLANIIVRHSSHTTAEGSGKNYRYSRIEYETHYQTKKKKKYAHLIYKDGKLAEENVLPPDNRATRPAVASELKNKSYDYLTLILKLREALYSPASKEFSFDVYDGRRLTRITASVIGKTTITYNNAEQPVIRVDLRRKLIAGFTKSELDDHDPDEGGVQAYFTDDDRRIPIRLEAQLMLGTLSATLVKECSKETSCLLGIKE